MKSGTIKNLKAASVGILIGAVNGMLGAGGGMVAVPMLRKIGLNTKSSHANAVAVILPITVISAVLYMIRGHVSFSDAWGYMPAGVIGSLIGTFVLKKISSVWLKRLFGAFMVYAGIRLLIK